MMAEMVARAIWKGTGSFELASIPIQVFSATQKEDFTSFDHLCEIRHKIENKKWCHIGEREVPFKNKKGYGITKNNYIVLEKEEIQNKKLKTTNRIEIKEFTDFEEFDPYFLKRGTLSDPIMGRRRKPLAP